MLNKNQKNAVKTKGDVIVVAGAGSGKTLVIQERVKEILKTKNATEILTITFTNKAAKEMKERIGNERVNTFTFHGWALSRLKKILEKSVLLGLNKDFDVVGEEDADEIIKFLTKNTDKDLNYRKIRTNISKLKSKNIYDTLPNFKQLVLEKYDEKTFEIYESYQSFLRRNNQADYDDILSYYLYLLDFGIENPEISDVLVDEAQDMNEVQKEIVRSLKRQGKRLFLVGDYDQSIYGWRGSNALVMQELKNELSLEMIELEETYRFHQKILENSEKIIKKNASRITKNTKTNVEIKGDVYYDEYRNDYNEGDEIAKKIKSLKTPREEIAILFRSRNETKPVLQALEMEKIDYVLKDKKANPFRQKEVEVAISLIRIKEKRFNNLDILKILKGLGIVGDTALDKIRDFIFKDKKPETVWNSLQKFRGENIDDLDGNSATILSGFKYVVDQLCLYNYEDMIEEVFTAFDVEKPEEEHPIWACFENIEGEDIVDRIIQERESFDELDEKIEGKVNVLTIHASKGLEFDDVFIPSVENFVFPRKPSEANWEEERRLLYVAATRAKNNVFISNAERRYIFGQETETGKSELIK